MTSKQQCGVAGCGNNAAPGKSFCVFHRNATAGATAETTPSPVIQPAAAAATGATSTPPQLFRAPSHGSSSSLGSGGGSGGSGDYSAATPPKFRAPTAPNTAAAAASTPPPPPPPAASAGYAAGAAAKVIPPPPPPPPAQSSAAAPAVPPPPPAQHAHASSTPPTVSKAVPPPPPPQQQHQHSASTSASPPIAAPGATPPAVPPRKHSVTQPPPSQTRATSGSSGVDVPASATPVFSPPPPPAARNVPPPPPGAASNASSSPQMPPPVKITGPMITTVNVRSPPMLPPPSGTAGAGAASNGTQSGLRTASSSVSFTRLPPTSRFSLSNNSSASGGSVSISGGPGGTLDLSSLKQLVYSHCTHIPEVLSAQVDTGIYAVHRIIAVLKRTISAEEAYWTQHIKTFEHESVKLERLSADGCERTHTAWTTFQQLQIEMAQRHLEGTAALTQHVLVPLLEYYSMAGGRKKELDKEIASKEKECHAARINMQKDLANAEKLIETWKMLKAQEEGGSSGAGSAGGAAGPNGQRPSLNAGESSGGGGGLFSKLSSKITSLSFSSSAAVVDKLTAASVKYTESLVASNRRSEIFITHELPAYLHELQRLEVQRLELSAQALAHWTALASERSGTIHTLFFLEALPKTIAPLDPERDIDESLSALVSLHGFAPAWSAVGYALPVSIEDIKAGRIRANANSVFHVSLAQLMEQQAASPSSGSSGPAASIPKFLSFTLDAIRAANGGKGLESEGVFRISPSKDEMEALKRGLDSIGAAALRKEDVIKGCQGNVYLACALLKEWLRSLKEAVIPTGKDGYDRAMAITKKHVAATAALDSVAAANTPAAEAAAANALLDLSSSLASFFAALPAVNRAVLQTLASFAVDEVVKQHATNRMTVENLSIVFAPCLLRSASEDPMELLNNSKHEIRFITLLFKFLATGAK